MARILTIDPEQARGLRKLLFRVNKRQYGGVVPGIFKIMFRDLNIAFPGGWIYNYLHMRKGSPLTRLQREMLATALISLFNFSGRLEAASGLPMDQIPEKARFLEATPGKPTVSARV